jgi:1-acyl-sn-glycerol-3-phosphate acyltransferase
VITFSGKENIPKEGATIFIANHPSALLDPLVLAALLNKQLYFLAAAEYMGKGLLYFFLERFIHMIPVYRPNIHPGEVAKNQDVFRKCYEHLDNDGVILIFPEGSSVTANRLQPLKTGTARIALGAAKNSNGKTKVNIVPIGLNYGDSHSFRKDLYVNIGAPVSIDDSSVANVTDDYEKVNALTQLMQDKLKARLIHLNDEKLDAIFEKIALVLNHNSNPKLTEKNNPEAKFELDQKIQEGLHYHFDKNPQVLDLLHDKIENYLQRISFYGVSDSALSTLSPKVKLYDYLRILLGIPIFALGVIMNSLPYYAAIGVFKRMKIATAFKGSIGLVIGMVFYLIWYIGLGILISRGFHHWWLGFVFFAIGYFTGRFAMHFVNLWQFLRKKGRLKKLLQTNRNVLRSLMHDRESIIKDIEKYSVMRD